jgi:hypothetical protein
MVKRGRKRKRKPAPREAPFRFIATLLAVDYAGWLTDSRAFPIALGVYFALENLVLPFRALPALISFFFSHVSPARPLVRYSNFVNARNATPSALLVYTTCRGDRFPVWKTPIPAVGIECDNETNSIDCHEAVPYLNFIIENYDRPLADKYIFAHGHEAAWHYAGNFFDALESLLRSTYFRKLKYGGVFRQTFSTGAWGDGEEHWARPLYSYVFKQTAMPAAPVEVGNQRPCCATFWLNSELIRNRKVTEYIAVRDALREWSKENRNMEPNPAYFCGRVMEYNWHILFTKKAFVDPCHLCQGE